MKRALVLSAGTRPHCFTPLSSASSLHTTTQHNNITVLNQHAQTQSYDQDCSSTIDWSPQLLHSSLREQEQQRLLLVTVQACTPKHFCSSLTLTPGLQCSAPSCNYLQNPFLVTPDTAVCYRLAPVLHVNFLKCFNVFTDKADGYCQQRLDTSSTKRPAAAIAPANCQRPLDFSFV